MPNENHSDTSEQTLANRKRKSTDICNDQSKMGGHKRKTNNSRVKSSAENIRNDILERQREIKKEEEEIPNSSISWRTYSVNCPPANPIIPIENLEKFVSFLLRNGHPRLAFWGNKYEEFQPKDLEDEMEDGLIDDSNSSICPVCLKMLPKSTIEAHADQCATNAFSY